MSLATAITESSFFYTFRTQLFSSVCFFRPILASEINFAGPQNFKKMKNTVRFYRTIYQAVKQHEACRTMAMRKSIAR